MSHGRYRLRRPQVVAEIVDDEVIAINMETGVYFNMRGWSAHVWTLLAAGHSLEEVTTTLVAAVGDVATDAVAEFFTALLADDLLVPDPDATPGDLPPAPAEVWGGLSLERFTDMTDLILLDPVHDVNPSDGWPKVDPDPA